MNTVNKPARSITQRYCGVAFGSFLHHYQVAAYCLLAPMFLWVFRRPIILILDNPFSFHPLQGVLVLGIAGYMAWCKRGALKKTVVSPSFFCGGLVLCFGGLLLITGRISNTLLIEAVAFPVGLTGLIFLISGWQVVRTLLMPLGFLIFLYPVVDKTFVFFSDKLELTAALIATQLLKLAGLSAFLENNVIEMPHIALKVVQACNGANHIVALTVLAFFITSDWNAGRAKRLLIVLSAVPLALFLNGLRIALIGVWTLLVDIRMVHGPFDLFFSSFTIIVGGTGMLAIRPLLENRGPTETTTYRGIGQQEPLSERREEKKTIYAFAVGVLVLAVSGAVPFFESGWVRSPTLRLNDFAVVIGGWTGKDIGRPTSSIGNAWFDSELRRTYQDRLGNKTELFIGYVRQQKIGKEIDDVSARDLIGAVPEKLKFKRMVIDTADVAVNEAQYVTENQIHRIFFWYQVGESVVTDRYLARLAILKESVFRRKTDAGLVVVTSTLQQGSDGLRQEAATTNFIAEIISEAKHFFN